MVLETRFLTKIEKFLVATCRARARGLAGARAREKSRRNNVLAFGFEKGHSQKTECPFGEKSVRGSVQVKKGSKSGCRFLVQNLVFR